MKRLLMVIGVVLALVSRAPAADPLPCFGDCDGDGSVAIAEIITCIRIALGRTAIEVCPDGDSDGDGRVAVNELIQTVAVALETDVPTECTARRCEFSGGSLGIQLCCRSTASFPDTCSVGACACAPQDSHEVTFCECGAGQCFDGASCIARNGLGSATRAPASLELLIAGEIGATAHAIAALGSVSICFRKRFDELRANGIWAALPRAVSG